VPEIDKAHNGESRFSRRASRCPVLASSLAVERAHDTDRSQMLAITATPERSCGRPSKASAEEGYARLAKIITPMLREAMGYEAVQADSENKGVIDDPET
jgi:hypothetical protein